ncbi:MAG TPA: rhomboid family intramembrane serine protease [Haliangiales bacterium]|nr:rhomboid family intramembrane serine protease [Haliangiales bacterium]
MEFDTILFWFVCVSCVSALLRALINRSVLDAGWVVVCLLILAMTVAGGWWNFRPAIYAGGVFWAVLVLVPALLARLHLRLFLQQRYRAARKLAQIVRRLHPAGGWREQPEILRALELAQAGDLESGVEILRRHQSAQGLGAAAAIANLYRLTNQWEEFIAWQEKQAADLSSHPQFIPVSLRACGEVGDLPRLVTLFDRHEKQIARLEPAVQRQLCRLMLFAFCGRRELAESLLAGPLAILPAPAKEFWLGTADFAAGRQTDARRALSGLLPEADPVTQRAIERRLSHPPAVAEHVLTPETKEIIQRAAQEQHHEDRFGAGPSLFSRFARACQIFIALNILVYLEELNLGGSTRLTVLFRLGALVPQAVHEGEWWRLVAANFLHYGVLHLTMNMLGLWILGPFVEFALGFRRFCLIYLLSGVGSMGTTLIWMTAAGGDQILVGASACVMGLVGGTGAILLRGWRQQKARIASRRLVSVLFIVALQTLFDWVVPQVSMAAHLSGLAIGFLTTLFLQHAPANAQQPSSSGK